MKFRRIDSGKLGVLLVLFFGLVVLFYVISSIANAGLLSWGLDTRMLAGTVVLIVFMMAHLAFGAAKIDD